MGAFAPAHPLGEVAPLSASFVASARASPVPQARLALPVAAAGAPAAAVMEAVSAAHAVQPCTVNANANAALVMPHTAGIMRAAGPLVPLCHAVPPRCDVSVATPTIAQRAAMPAGISSAGGVNTPGMTVIAAPQHISTRLVEKP